MDGCAVCTVLATMVAATAAIIQGNITTGDQLPMFKREHPGPIGVLTTSYGYPVAIEDTVSINSRLLLNEYLFDSLTHLDRERIPERVVHAKAAGAFGHFKVTHDLSDLSKAKLFDTLGKVTPVTVRFSPVFQERGGSDLARETRGFAIKFYTEDGNFDFVALNIEMFLLKDPIVFTTFVHSFGRNPKTNVRDVNSVWDFLTLRPEALHTFMRIFGDRGIPDGYRFLPGFTIHTFELYNKEGDKSYVRFHMLPDAGIKTLTTAEAMQITDPDYATRDLYNAIANGNFPTWTLYVQVLKWKDLEKVKFDIFDITKMWPLKEYPLREVGQLVLNKNPENYFADIEQLAFSPGNLVPGIRGVDSVFEARVLSYRVAHYHRLGSNPNRIQINCPLLAKTYNRDGTPPVLRNGEDSPNYYPNSFHGPMPYLEKNRPPRTTVYTEPRVNNFDQAREIYVNEMSEGERCRLVSNIVSSLGGAARFLQERAVKWYKMIDIGLGGRVEYSLIRNQTETC